MILVFLARTVSQAWPLHYDVPEQIRAVYGRITGLVDGDASQPYARRDAGCQSRRHGTGPLMRPFNTRLGLLLGSRGPRQCVEFAHALLAFRGGFG